MTPSQITALTDIELLAETARIVDTDRRTTVELLDLLAEIETRKLFLGESCSSLFTYCTQVLRMSESVAYSRITAARVARRFPIIIPLLVEGAVNLTTIRLLAAHLTDENHEAVLDAARHKSKREICGWSRRSIRNRTSRQPFARFRRPRRHVLCFRSLTPARNWHSTPASRTQRVLTNGFRHRAQPPSPDRRSIVAPLAPERYLVKITIGREAHDKLERARDLLRHSIPNGDPAAIVERALTVLIAQLEKTKLAVVTRPRARKTSSTRRTRHIPAAIKREVWARDGGQCAFVGTHGRCTETGFVEIHHLLPFAADGPTTVENLELRCRAHNAFEAELFFGRSAPS